MARRAPPPPAPPPPAQPAAQVLRRAVLAGIAQRLRDKRPVAPHELRFLEAEEARASGATWPDRAACCRELGEAFKRKVAVNQLYEWKRDGAPIPSRGAIDKAALWRWFAVDHRGRGRPTAAGDAVESGDPKGRLTEKQIEFLSLKVDSMAGTMRKAHEVEADITAATQEVATRLRHDLPARAVDAALTKDRTDAEEAIRALIDQALTALHGAAARYRPAAGG